MIFRTLIIDELKYLMKMNQKKKYLKESNVSLIEFNLKPIHLFYCVLLYLRVIPQCGALVPNLELEPTILRLRISCSTDWASHLKNLADILVSTERWLNNLSTGEKTRPLSRKGAENWSTKKWNYKLKTSLVSSIIFTIYYDYVDFKIKLLQLSYLKPKTTRNN